MKLTMELRRIGVINIVLIGLVVLVPVCTIYVVAYQFISGKSDPTIFIVLAAIPGALVAGWKSLKELGVLRPRMLELTVISDKVKTISWTRGVFGTNITQRVVDIVIPIRINNRDVEKAVDILDIEVRSTNLEVMNAPEMQEVSLGSEKKWVYPMGSGTAYSELFNDGVPKTLEAAKIKDYIVGIREVGEPRNRSSVNISFRDNFGREYSADVLIPLPEEMFNYEKTS
ncbi:MAG TPA: hypothetical protein PK108_05030 [Pyrinomonadaceae bacterium]|jgi:hypothetical protein|nr:hypothetical protein [Pyrinomonadaceae bacterium]